MIDLFFYFQLTLISYGYLSLLIGNVQRNCSTVIQFIPSWDDTMFRHQFRMCGEDFYALEKVITDQDMTWSSGSPVTSELWPLITLRLLSGAMYLDMIWYGVTFSSIPSLFWQTNCEIDKAPDNIRFPMDSIEIMQMVGKVRESIDMVLQGF